MKVFSTNNIHDFLKYENIVIYNDADIVLIYFKDNRQTSKCLLCLNKTRVADDVIVCRFSHHLMSIIEAEHRIPDDDIFRVDTIYVWNGYECVSNKSEAQQ